MSRLFADIILASQTPPIESSYFLTAFVIAIFKVKADQTLEAAGHLSGDIKIPRNFNIDPSGKWMLIASQDGGKVDVWELDTNSGNGKKTANSAKVSKCVCVKFVPVEK